MVILLVLMQTLVHLQHLGVEEPEVDILLTVEQFLKELQLMVLPTPEEVEEEDMDTNPIQ